MGGNLFRVHDTADERRKRGIVGRFCHGIEARVRQIADARSKPEPQQMAYPGWTDKASVSS